MARSSLFSPSGRSSATSFQSGGEGPFSPITSGAKYSITPDRRGDDIDYSTREWQKCVWELYDVVAEIQMASRLTANAASMVRICPAKIDGCEVARLDFSDEEVASGVRGGDAGDPIDPEDIRAADIGNQILNNVFGKSGQSLVFRLAMENIFIGGEAWLVQAVDEISGELLQDEFEVMNPCRVVKGPNNEHGYYDCFGEFVAFRDDQTVIRLLYPHPRDPRQAMSSVRSVMHEAQILVLLRHLLEATAKSGIHGGITAVPDELTTTLGREEFEARLMKSYLAGIADPSSPTAVAPTIVFGAAEYIENLRHIDHDRPFDEVLLDAIARLEARLLRGMDLPVEIIAGIGEATHWSSWEITSTYVRNHIKPGVDIIIEALYRKIYRGALIENGIDPDKYCYDADLTEIAGEPNKAKNANDAFDRGCLACEPYLSAMGFNPASDMADPLRDPRTNRAPIGDGVGGTPSTDRADGVNPSRPDDNINNMPINGNQAE